MCDSNDWVKMCVWCFGIINNEWPICSSLYGYTIIKMLWCKTYPMCCHLTWLFLMNRLHLFDICWSLGKLWHRIRWLQSATSHTLMSSLFFFLALLAMISLVQYYEEQWRLLTQNKGNWTAWNFWRWSTCVRFLVLSQIHATLMICLHVLYLD